MTAGCRYLDIIMKQKRISESGTQQLLLDTYNIKTMLLQLHHLGLPAESQQGPERSAVPPMYLKFITSKVTHIEVILKLIGTPEDMLLERFKIMWTEGGAADLQAVLSLQGVKKQEQQGYLEQFGRDTGKYLDSQEGEEGGGRGQDGKAHPGGSGSSNSSGSSFGASTSTATSGLTSSMTSSMRSVTQDLSSSTRSAIGDLTKSFKFGRNT